MDKTGKTVEQSFKEEMDRASGAGTPATPATPAASDPAGSSATPTKDATAAASPTYEFNGRQLTAEQLYEETRNLQKDYTQKSQKLAELEKQHTPPAAPATPVAPSKGDNGQQLSDVDRRMQSELKRLGYVSKEDVEELLSQKKPELIQESSKFTQSQLDVNSRFDKLEADFNGENGKPKVERSKVLEFINANKLYSLTPEQATNLVYQEEMVQWKAKELAGGSTPSLPVTEKSGAAVTEPPKPPANQYSFSNGLGEKAVREMLGQTR